jgi:hypothetical protein
MTYGRGLEDPTWKQADGHIVAGTLKDGTLLVKTRQADGTFIIDTVPLDDLSRAERKKIADLFTPNYHTGDPAIDGGKK